METHPRAMETHPRSSQDPRGWKEEEQEQEQGGPSDERFQERPLPVHLDATVSSRQRYEGTPSINMCNPYLSPVPPPSDLMIRAGA